MPMSEQDGISAVVISLVATAVALMAAGLSLIMATKNHTIGMVLIGAGAIDAVMALIFSRRK